MSIPTQTSNLYNPFSGVFGNGQVETFSYSRTFTVPVGVSKVRVRLWGAGGSGGGGGGGFAMKVCNVTPGSNIAVTTGYSASSFGTFVSATQGANTNGVGGTGVGGDINHTGGQGSTAGGGVANLFGNGGRPGQPGTSGGGAIASGNTGYAGLNTSGGFHTSTSSEPKYQPVTHPIFSMDFLGTGPGGGYNQMGVNGGGTGGGSTAGSFPGGGGVGATGGYGFVIVEY